MNNGKDFESDFAKAIGSNDSSLGFSSKRKEIRAKDVKSGLTKKKRVNVSGPHEALKILKPNVGLLGMQQNIGKRLSDFSLNSKDKGKAPHDGKLDYASVIVSDKLNKDAHTIAKFKSKEIPVNTKNKQNIVFLFRTSRTSQWQKYDKPPDINVGKNVWASVKFNQVVEGLVTALDNSTSQSNRELD